MLGRKNRSLVGLDIGSSVVKVVELRCSGTSYGLVAAGIEPLPREASSMVPSSMGALSDFLVNLENSGYFEPPVEIIDSQLEATD